MQQDVVVYDFVITLSWMGGKGSAVKIHDEIIFVLDKKLWHFNKDGEVICYDLSEGTILTEGWGAYTKYLSHSGLTGDVVIGVVGHCKAVPAVRLDASWRDRIVYAGSSYPEPMVVYHRKEGWVKLTTLPPFDEWENYKSFQFLNEHRVPKRGIRLELEGTTIRVVPYYERAIALELYPGLWLST